MSTVLPLRDMDVRHYGLTPAIAANNAEAAAVCLSRHHSPPTTFTIEDGADAQPVRVEWVSPDSRTLGAWNNSTDATEMGAYACAIAAVEIAREQFAVRRAETGTGADYYVGPAGAGVDDLEDCYRLEVSGVDAGEGGDLRRRLLQKCEQARHGDSSLPAVAGVVGFAARLIVLATVEGP